MSILKVAQEVEEFVNVSHERGGEKMKMMGWTLTAGALQECTFQEITIKCHHPTVNIISHEASCNYKNRCIIYGNEYIFPSKLVQESAQIIHNGSTLVGRTSFQHNF